MRVPALVLAPGALMSPAARVAHAVIRGGERFRITAVVDPDCEGEDAGSLIDHKHRGVPVVASIDEAIDEAPATPEYCIIGMETDDGALDGELRQLVIDALKTGLPIVNPLPTLLCDDAELVALARAAKVELIDLCRPPAVPVEEPGEPRGNGNTPRIAIVGTGTAVGKHTTARLLLKALRHAGLNSELIYTGQTGWLQGGRFGVVLDALADDEVLDALNRVVLDCIGEAHPAALLVEGHSSKHELDDTTLMQATGARLAVLQHAIDSEDTVPLTDKLAELQASGADVLAITLRGRDSEALASEAERLQRETGLPVLRPACEGVTGLVPLLLEHVDAGKAEKVLASLNPA